MGKSEHRKAEPDHAPDLIPESKLRILQRELSGQPASKASPG